MHEAWQVLYLFRLKYSMLASHLRTMTWKSPPKWFSSFQQLGWRKMCCFSKQNCKWPWNLAEEWRFCQGCFFCYPVTIQANLAKLKEHTCSVNTYQDFTTITSKISRWMCFGLLQFLVLSRWWDAVLKYDKNTSFRSELQGWNWLHMMQLLWAKAG